MQKLYQEVVLEHNRRPRNFRVLTPHSHRAEGHNPLCGDQVEVRLQVVDDVIREAAFQGEGCAICTASSSLMTEVVTGLSATQAQKVFDDFHRMLAGDAPERLLPEGAKLTALAGVRDYPSRIKCASLPWHALKAALAHENVATTEHQGDAS